MSVTSNIFTPMQSTNQGSIISVRTSDARFQTLSSGGSYSHSTTQQSTVFHHDYNRADTWNHITLPVTTATGKTTSFTAIHEEVSANVMFFQPKNSSGRPGGPPTTGNGDTPPPTGSLLPVGDMLIPMLLIALGYVVVKLFRNRKTSQAL